jgi:hypothetical protein
MASYSTTFTTDEDPLSESGVWTNGPGAWDACKKLGGIACVSAIGGNGSVARLLTPPLGSNHYASVLIVTNLSGGEQGPVTRIQSTTDGSCYQVTLESTGNTILYRVDDTGTLAFAQLGSTIAGTVAGDHLRLESSGTTHTVIRNGVTVLTFSDATYSGGQPGILAYAVATIANHTLDNWVGGDLPGSGPPTFVNAGTEGTAASGNITLGAPATPATNDVWIAVVHSSDQVAHTFTNWTEIIQGNGGGTTSRLSVWYFRYAGSTPNLIVTHTAGQTPIGGIVAFRGCKTTGSPVNIVGTMANGTDASIESNAITPTVANCMILFCDGAADDNNRTPLPAKFLAALSEAGPTNAFLSALGTPDGSVALHYRPHTVGVTGVYTDTQAAVDPWASVLVALEPEPEAVGGGRTSKNIQSFPLGLHVGLSLGIGGSS